MPTLAKLYQQAKQAGFSSSEIRGKSAAEIEEMMNGGASKPKAVKKSAVKKAVATVTKKRGRGRPPGSKNKSTVAKKSSTVTKKRGPGRPRGSANQTTRKTATKSKPRATSRRNGNSSDGRHLLSKVNYSRTDGWNPREGSPPDRIIKALKKHRGDREQVFKFLKPSIWDFMGKVKRDGTKRTKAEAEAMLRYRIARTDWQFALATGQHEIATDRAEYGTAGTGEGTFKRSKSTKKSTAKTSTAKRGRGRPRKSTNRSRQSASKTPARANASNAKEMSTAALKRYVKSFEGKRGRRPAEYAGAVKELAKRK